jgi:uncharacterized protein with von Willebrand factor type A (vWA) domain
MNFDFDMDKFFSEDEVEDEFLKQEIDAINLAGKKIEDMTDEEKEKFKNSSDYKEFSANFQETEHIEGNMNGKTVQEVLGLSNKKKSVRYSYNSVEAYDEDIMAYEDIVDQSPIMQDTLVEGEELLPTFKYLYQDIFLSLYKYDVQVLPIDKIHIEVRMNRNIMEQLVNTPEYISLRRTCRMDEFNAALGAEIIGQEAIELLKEMLDNIKNKQQQLDAMDQLVQQEEMMDSLAEDIDDIQDQIDELLQQGNSEQAALLQQQMDGQMLSLENMRARAEAIAQQCDELVNDDEDSVLDMTRKMGTAYTKATEQVVESTKLCEAWGLGVGQEVRVAYQNKKDAIEKIRRSSKLGQMTDIIGRMKESAITEQKKKAKHGAVEIKTTTMGNKIQDTLPSERMNMINDVTKKDFMRRMTENSLMVYEKESNKQKNKGPIIVCVDTSGSMSGNQEIWSKAMACGVLEIAQYQKRDFACILYSSRAEEPIIIKKDEISPEKIIQVAERFSGGGTNFEAPLQKACKLIEDSTFKEADILFISDGDCGVSSDFLRKFKRLKEEKEFRCFGVLVDVGGHSAYTTLNEFCDNVTNISNIAELSNADSDVNKGIFGAL